jgi:diacylglycerol kinase
MTTKPERRFSFASFRYAANGLIALIQHTPNAKVELVIAAVAVLGGFAFAISPAEWLAVIILIGLVLSLEALNTAIELTLDVLHPGIHPTVKIIKDLAAGAVLLASLAALIAACLIYLPKIFLLLLEVLP